MDDREEYLSRLGLVLQLARKAAKLTQERVASDLGIAADTVSRWEAGTNAISSYDLIRLVRLYDFDPDLVVNPPSSRPEIKRRLAAVATIARRASRKAILRPLEGDGEPG